MWNSHPQFSLHDLLLLNSGQTKLLEIKDTDGCNMRPRPTVVAAGGRTKLTSRILKSQDAQNPTLDLCSVLLGLLELGLKETQKRAIDVYLPRIHAETE